jgi:hypothetical protein
VLVPPEDASGVVLGQGRVERMQQLDPVLQQEGSPSSRQHVRMRRTVVQTRRTVLGARVACRRDGRWRCADMAGKA